MVFGLGVYVCCFACIVLGFDRTVLFCFCLVVCFKVVVVVCFIMLILVHYFNSSDSIFCIVVIYY